MLFPSSFQRRISGLLLLSTATILNLSAQTPSRIAGTVDNSSTVRLPRTTHPLAAPANDLGRADASLPMQRILLHLSSSAAQEAAIEQLIAAQHDPASASYHQWLTPAQFGAQFGASQADVDTVTGWLQSQGFTVSGVAAGRRSIELSGTAGQVEKAFHTEMHRYRVDGVEHVANAGDISIPRALAPVVSGVVSLHNFGLHPLHTVIKPVINPAANPQTDLNGGAHSLSPYDFAAIYDVAALWNLNFDGTGQSVAVAGRTNVNLTDVATFRSTFGLPANAPQVVVNGTNPGIVSSGEETEADLDVEWAGAVAKGAVIKFVVSASTNTTDGIDLSSAYIVDNNLAPVMSLSFGGCEAQNGSDNSFYNSLWQQATAQGISVFVAAGDSGSAGCDLDYSTSSSGADNTTPASGGFAVNGLASTPYNVAVGGTEFNDAASPSTYWNSSNSSNYSSAKGYIPEVAWNESSYTAGAGNNSLYAGGGGVSGLYSTPSWQTGAGVPTSDPSNSAQHHRYLPDVSLTAAGHDGYLIYQEGNLELVGGTSAATPSFAGLMAILDQYSGGRSGNPNTKLYSLAAQYPSLFHDTTGGTNAVPCAGGSANCSSSSPSVTGVMNGYTAGAGYDLATGLGSVDAYALALKWGGGQTAPQLSINSLSPNPMTASATNQTLTINGAGFQTGATVKVSYTGFSGTLAVTSLTSTQILATINTGTASNTWTVQVVNPGGAASNSASLTVKAPLATPAITSLNPNPMAGSNNSQVLTIAGSGFVSGDTVRATYSGGPVYSLQIASLSATQIQAYIATGTTARTWTVQVVNANSVASNSASLTVTAPATPVITSASPLHATSTLQTLTINGTGFTPGSGLRVVVGYNGYGYYYTVVSATATQITVQVDPGATNVHTWECEVIDSDNVVSNVATFTVN